MIQKFVDRFMASKDTLRARFATHPKGYEEIVKAVIEVISSEEDYYDPDPERIHLIDDGDYRGTLVFVIGAKGYQPSNYWTVLVSYGSCSGCDTLEAIKEYSDEPATSDQLDQYVTLALHIVQGIKAINGDRNEEN